MKKSILIMFCSIPLVGNADQQGVSDTLVIADNFLALQH